MTQLLFILAGILALATLGVLLYGVGRMSGQGVENARKSNKLMQYRVVLQAGVVLILFIIGVVLAK